MCAFDELAAPVATSPPAEPVVTGPPLSARSPTTRPAPDCVLFERTTTPDGGLRLVDVESLWSQYEIAHAPDPGALTTGVVCDVAAAPEARANAATGLDVDVPR